MIDRAGFRHGVGIILVNQHQRVFFAKRVGMKAWQFPQGGMKENETPLQTMYRELWEEVGLSEKDVEVVASTRSWLHYRLPKRLVRQHVKPLCIGQKQKWFLLRPKHPHFLPVDLNANTEPEFDDWAWVSYWSPLRRVIPFKRRVYVAALKEFAKFVFHPPPPFREEVQSC